MWVTRGRHIEIDVLRGYFRPGLNYRQSILRIFLIPDVVHTLTHSL